MGLNNLLRIAVKCLAVVLLLGVVWVFACIVINRRDEPLSPQALALAAKTALPPADANGYYVLFALSADDNADVMATGREAVQKLARLASENPNATDLSRQTDFKHAPHFTWQVHRCTASEHCAKADVGRRAALTEARSHSAALLQRYALLQQMPNFEEPAIYAPAAPIPGYTELIAAHDMSLVEAAFDIADGRLANGIAILQKNDAYVRQLMRQSSTLISRMVAVAMMRRQARAVSELSDLYPALSADHGDQMAALVRPLSSAEQSFRPVFRHEAQYGVTAVRALDFESGRQDTALAHLPRHWSERVSAGFFDLFYQRNATANLLVRTWSPLLEDADKPATDYTAIRSRAVQRCASFDTVALLLQPNGLINPTGKLLVALSSIQPAMVDYMERSADADGYLRLVGLKIDAQRKHIPLASMQDFVNASAASYRSPYDGTPMLWSSEKRQLQFIGRQKATSNSEPKNRYAVQMS